MGKRTKKTAEDAHDADGFLPLMGNNDCQVQSLSVKKKVLKQDFETSSKMKPTVLYIGRIPHGFYEDQMRGFFSQFGTIKCLRISRNKKTGNSRHYGFIEFESPEVAEIVADSLHNYLLFEHILQVRLVPPEALHSRLWEGANCKFKHIKWQKIEMKCHNKERTGEEHHQKLVKTILKKDAKRRKKIEASGIEYEYPDITEALPPISKKIKFSADEE